MRVAIFVDGKNFHAGLRDAAPGVTLDFNKLAKWLVSQVDGGSQFWGAHYYTGIESSGAAATSDGQKKLAAFLDTLELQPGYFVRRFPRKTRDYPCPHCNAKVVFTQEKEVDTSMVADMLRLAAVDAFEVLVLVSGDADHAPALEGVRALGKQAYVATWGLRGLASRLRKAAFAHIDLSRGLEVFQRAELPSAGPVTLADTAVIAAQPMPTPSARASFLAELTRASNYFGATGFAGVNHFVTKWKTDALDPSPDVRRRLLDALVKEGAVEIYDAPNGTKALRTASPRITGDG